MPVPTIIADVDVMDIDPPDDFDGGDDDRGPIRWITVATFSRPTEVHIARLKLESEGIECLITDENIVATDFLYALAVGGIKLQVATVDAERGRALLAAPRMLPRQAQSLAACPECGSEHLDRPILQRQTVWAAMVALMILSTVLLAPLALAGFIYYIIMWRPLRCRDCGNTFGPNLDGQRGFQVVASPDSKTPGKATVDGNV